MNHELTLAICMYNAERYIEETLRSIMIQTKQDFHLLIVNDCSTDRSTEVVKRFFQKHSRQYELVNFEENRGLSAGRRYVEEYAKTQYLLFVDSDDILYPAYVETLFDKISSDSDLMAVGCYVEYINSTGKKMGGGIYIGAKSKEEFYRKATQEKLIFSIATSIYDRELALRVGGHNVTGFPEGKPRYQDLCEDLDLWTRMSDLYTEGKAIVIVPEILYQYRKHEQAVSSNSLGMLLRMRHIKTNLKRRRRGEPELSFIDFRAQMAEGEYRKLEKEARAADSLRRAYYLLRSRHWATGAKSLLSSICSNPGYIADKIKHNLLKHK